MTPSVPYSERTLRFLSRAPDDGDGRLRRPSPGPRDLIRIAPLRKVFGSGTRNERVAPEDVSCSIREDDFVSILELRSSTE